MRLANKTAIITGAGSGIGLAMAKAFTREGAKVIGVDIRADRIDALPEAVPGVVPVVADVTNGADIDRIVDVAGPELDIVCNNAGILDGMAPVDETSDETWKRVLDVNLTATFRLCRQAIPVLLAHGGGVILNTASGGGPRGGRAGAAYTASKFGVVGLTQNIAVTHGPQGIRCNALAPGSTFTNIGEGVDFKESGLHLITRDSEAPLPSAPDRIAEAAVFLVSDEASHVNGVILPVDAGLLAF